MKDNSKLKHTLKFFTVLFVIIFIIGYFSVFSSGGSLIWNVDGVGQYYPSFVYIGEYLQSFLWNLLHGNWSLPTFDLSIGMGEDIIGSLNYYGFGDPLNLLAVFVTKNNSAVIFSMMIILKMWLSGISLLFYFDYLHIKKIPSILATLSYVFCGFSIYGGTCYSEWLSVLIYTPLILLGIEKIINEGKVTLFILSIGYAGLCGFYFLFMTSLILVLYLPVRLLFKGYHFKLCIKTVLLSILCYFVGIFFSAPFFFPSVGSYFNSERKTDSIQSIIFNINNYIPNFNINIWEYLKNPFYESISLLSGILLVELMAMILLIFLPKTKKKQQCIIFLICCCVAFSLPITGYIFNGFGQSNYRWVYIIHLTFAGIFAFVFSEYLSIWEEKKTSRRKQSKIKYVSIALIILTSVNIIINIQYLYSEKHFGWVDEMIQLNEAKIYLDSPYNYTDISEKDEDLFRIANDSLTGVNGRPENIAMLNNYYSLTYWFSIINQNSQLLVNQKFGGDLRWRSFGFGDDHRLNTLLGVKYYMTQTTLADQENYLLIEQVNFNNTNWNIYEILSYNGISYVVDEKSIGDENQSIIENINNMYSTKSNSDASVQYTDDQFIIDVKANSSENLVLSLPYHKNWTAHVNGKKVNVEKTSTFSMTVPLEDGENKVQFVYRNKFITIGMICFCLAILFIWKTKKISFKYEKCPIKEI